ncbi:hypothetical protein OAG36_01140 [bacterium]|nr:hypothetical protein [bacterium]
MSSHLTDDLIESLKRITAIPVSQATFTDDILVDFLNDELISTITPILMDIREEFMIDYVDYDLSSVGTTLTIPSNTVGERLRDVVMVTTATNGDESYTNLPKLSIESLSSAFNEGSNISNSGFIIQGNTVKLYPQSGWGDVTVRLYYYRRPNDLCLVADAAKITQITPGTLTATVNVVPSSWVIGTELDSIQDNQPFGTTNTALEITNIAGQNIVLDSVDGLVVGDYLSLTGTAPLAQVPKEAQRLLVQSTKVQILESLDDDKNHKLAKAKYDSLLTDFLKAVTNRVEGQPKKIVSKNNIFNATRAR